MLFKEEINLVALSLNDMYFHRYKGWDSIIRPMVYPGAVLL